MIASPDTEPIPFLASSAEEAVALIRERLGPEAVVVNVRQVPANGLARLWQKPMIEVLACKPEPSAPVDEPPSITEALADFRQQLDEIKQQIDVRPEPEIPPCETETIELNAGQWRIGSALQKSGMLPLHVQTVLDKLQAERGHTPPLTLHQEMIWTQAVLAKSWRNAPPVAGKSLHVLIGAAGCGKTTSLCKWLTQAVLVEGQSARVWRLDGATANTAESLSVHCEILGAPHQRSWERGALSMAEDIGFIDLPGVDWRNPAAIEELGRQIKQFGPARVHLVLNGAYDISILLAQARAFASLLVEDLIITHLDEEQRWGKFWNLVLGTNYSVRYFSAGQNIPGDLRPASPEMIFARQFPKK